MRKIRSDAYRKKGKKNLPEKSANRVQYGKRMGIFGIITNLLLFAAKLTVGIASGSISVTADAVNNLSDAGSSLLTLAGFYLSERPADKEHPYGHARMESITGVILSVSVIFVSFQLLGESLSKIKTSSASSFDALAVTLLSISIAVKLAQGVIYRKNAKKISSTTLRAAGIDSFTDAGITAAVMVGGFFERFVSLDGYLGVFVSVCIFITGIKLVKECASPLLGSAPSEALVEEVRRRLAEEKKILGFHDLLIHTYGEGDKGRNFATVHVEVNAHMTLTEVHEIIDGIERRFDRELGLQTVIHPDPVDPDDKEGERLKEEVRGILSHCCPQAILHDFHLIRSREALAILFDVGVRIEYRESDQALSERLEREIARKIPGVRPVITVDRNYVGSDTIDLPDNRKENF